MTTGGVGDDDCGRVITTGGGGRMGGGGVRIGGGGGDCSPASRRRSSSSQLVGRGVGRGWLAEGGGCRGLDVESSRPSAALFFIQVAIAETTTTTSMVKNESIARGYFWV